MKLIIRFFISFTFLLYGASSFAENFPNKPKIGTFIVDEALMISAQDAAMINQVSSRLLKEKKIPIFVVTIESLAKYQASSDIESYATNLFTQWGIGYKDYNYGILLLVSKSDRKARIEFGASFNHKYDNAALNIMSSLIIPNFKNGNFSGGLLAGVNSLDAMARDANLPNANVSNNASSHESSMVANSQQNYPNQQNSAAQPNSISQQNSFQNQTGSSPQMSQASSLFLMLIFIALVVFIAYSLFKSGKKGWAWAFLAAVALFIWFIISNSGRSGGDGGGFGGGSGGGGGASGSW